MATRGSSVLHSWVKMMRCSSWVSAASAMARGVVVMARVVGAMARSSPAPSLREGDTRTPIQEREQERERERERDDDDAEEEEIDR
eukprot:scaffold38088_cov61-Phaeocystis_antarctica.AAC.4